MTSVEMYEYPQSKQIRGDSEYCIVKKDGFDFLKVSGSDADMFEDSVPYDTDKAFKLFPLTVNNSKILRSLFDFTNPVRHKGYDITIGLGDRLGLASPGHIQAVRDLNVFPVLAQQSMRELDLTGRTYDEVLSAAVWAVFREGYKKGFGADGDHLKTYNEVKNAIDCGFSMITLDCSEHIENDLFSASNDIIESRYNKLDKNITEILEKRYLSTEIKVAGSVIITLNEQDFRRIVLIYLPVVMFAADIYHSLIKEANVDFEVSIDETSSTTSPAAHYFTANELILRDVEITSLAPRFPGEFQKGIDYIGDIAEFEHDFNQHAKIAETFGYKISVHSGSDKFSIFPAVGRLSGSKYHLKTAGTSWLEAVRVISENDAELYRDMHEFALENLSDAKKYYVITENTANITDINKVSDSMLPEYLDNIDARRVLHITYGLLLMKKAENGSYVFRKRIYDALDKYSGEYTAALNKHIGKHLSTLGV